MPTLLIAGQAKTGCPSLVHHSLAAATPGPTATPHPHLLVVLVLLHIKLLTLVPVDEADLGEGPGASRCEQTETEGANRHKCHAGSGGPCMYQCLLAQPWQAHRPCRPTCLARYMPAMTCCTGSV